MCRYVGSLVPRSVRDLAYLVSGELQVLKVGQNDILVR